MLRLLYPYREQSKMRIEKGKDNLRVIEGDNGRAKDNGGLQKLPVMKPLKEMVELTGFSYTHLRNLCLQNEIVHIRAGKKFLINYDRFCDYLNGIEQ